MIEFDNLDPCGNITSTVRFTSFENEVLNQFFEDLKTYDLATIEVIIGGSNIIQIKGDMFLEIDEYIYQATEIIIDRNHMHFVLIGSFGTTAFYYPDIESISLKVKVQGFV